MEVEKKEPIKGSRRPLDKNSAPIVSGWQPRFYMENLVTQSTVTGGKKQIWRDLNNSPGYSNEFDRDGWATNGLDYLTIPPGAANKLLRFDIQVQFTGGDPTIADIYEVSLNSDGGWYASSGHSIVKTGAVQATRARVFGQLDMGGLTASPSTTLELSFNYLANPGPAPVDPWTAITTFAIDWTDSIWA